MAGEAHRRRGGELKKISGWVHKLVSEPRFSASVNTTALLNSGELHRPQQLEIWSMCQSQTFPGAEALLVCKDLSQRESDKESPPLGDSPPQRVAGMTHLATAGVCFRFWGQICTWHKHHSQISGTTVIDAHRGSVPLHQAWP